MKNNGLFAGIFNQQPSSARVRRAAGVMAVAMFIATAGVAVAQDSAPGAPAPESKFSTPDGYSSHHSIDAGGRMANISGSGSMYDTLVNLQSGPRVFGESYSMHALPSNKKSLVDDLSMFGTGFGGDPAAYTKLDASKGKLYEFTGVFRRNRLYSDYDLLANPNIPGGLSIPIGPANAPVGSLPWGPVNQSPVMFNTVRRMLDTNVTIRPFDTFSYRLGFSHYIMQGPTLSPSYTILKYNAILEQYERNGSNDFLGAIDWKPQPRTKITFEAEVNRYKSDTYFTLNPNGFQVQEADGTPVYLGNFSSSPTYGNPVTGPCNTGSMGSGYTSSTIYTILSPPNTPGAMPIINAACAVVTSYIRTQQTRNWTPTGTFRIQSSAFKDISLNGDVHYTRGGSHLPSYYENAQGLSTLATSGIGNGTANRSVIWTGGKAQVQHAVVGADFGIVWHVAPAWSVADQATFSSTHEPGSSIIPPQTALATPVGAGNATINYSGTLVPGTVSLPHGINGTLLYNYYGQEYFINNLTASWDPSALMQFSLTYRYSNRNIGQGIPHQGPIPTAPLADPVNGTVTINENAGIFNAAVHPVKNWDLNGSIEFGYADNAFTAVGQRQFQTYRMHTIYKPKSWATVTGSFSDRERHNNTNNNQGSVTAGDANYNGPINHQDHSRIGSVGVVLAPSALYSFNVNYSYSDVYAATNICFSNGATAATATMPAIPGAASVLPGTNSPNLCSGNSTWFARDFMDAPTNFASVGLTYTPITKVNLAGGYTISSVNGSRFFNDPRDVNGSMVSAYQSPYLSATYIFRPGFSWKAEYNYYGYGEGGPSGATLCSVNPTTVASTVVPCSSFAAGLTAINGSPVGFTAPRNFHANNVTLGMHYEF